MKLFPLNCITCYFRNVLIFNMRMYNKHVLHDIFGIMNIYIQNEFEEYLNLLKVRKAIFQSKISLLNISKNYFLKCLARTF